jgi:homoserine dehydrogenase
MIETMTDQMRVAVLGVGTIGRELLRLTRGSSEYNYVALADTSGVITRNEGFTDAELAEIIKLKESGRRLGDVRGNHELHEDIRSVLNQCLFDALVDATATQTYDLIHEALDHGHVVTANKIPLADVDYLKFKGLVTKAREKSRVLDYGTTAGAGMRIPDLIEGMGSNGIDRLTGCLSGTMSFVSQRLNAGASLSSAIGEAMEPPRSYTEPDPRVDLGGLAFARKLVILASACGRDVGLETVEIEGLVPDHLKGVPLERFLENLADLDSATGTRFETAKAERKVSWYVGTADLVNDKYTIGFEDFPAGDPIASSKESDNVLKLYPTGWGRPVTVIGPGAGPTETATGVIRGLKAVSNAL